MKKLSRLLPRYSIEQKCFDGTWVTVGKGLSNWYMFLVPAARDAATMVLGLGFGNELRVVNNAGVIMLELRRPAVALKGVLQNAHA